MHQNEHEAELFLTVLASVCIQNGRRQNSEVEDTVAQHGGTGAREIGVSG